MEWEVPGYELVELIGFGVLGEVWRARDSASGQVVAVRRLDAHEALEEVRRRVALLRAVRSEHLVRVRSVTAGAVVLDHVPGGSLAGLLAGRGPLTPGQVVTVIAPVALALGEAHDRGLVHGRLDPREVLLTADGRPLLDGLALSFLYDAQAGAVSDVRALGRMARQLLPSGADAPEAMARAIERALDPAPGSTATQLGEALLRSCPAEPLIATARPDPPVLLPLAPAPHVTTSKRVPVLGAGLLLVLIVVTAAVQLRPAMTRHTSQVPPQAVTPSPDGPDWTRVLEQLDQARAAAFAAGDPLALAQVYVPGGPAEAADRQVMARLAAQHLRARGVRHRVMSLTAARLSPLRVELHVAETLSGYDLVGADGHVQHRPAGAVERRVLALRRTPGGWRVESVST